MEIGDDFTLNVWLTNQILDVIEEAGMAPSDFTWGARTVQADSGSYSAPVLRHLPTSSWMMFASGYVQFCPGDLRRTESTAVEDDELASILPQIVGDWLGFVENEQGRSDLWAMLSQSSSAEDIAGTGNALITPDERKRIGQSLGQIKGYLLQAQPFSPEQNETINERFQDMEAALDRIEHKRDWVMFFWGNFINLLMVLFISNQNGTDLLNYAQAAFQWLTGTLPQLK